MIMNHQEVHAHVHVHARHRNLLSTRLSGSSALISCSCSWRDSLVTSSSPSSLVRSRLLWMLLRWTCVGGAWRTTWIKVFNGNACLLCVLIVSAKAHGGIGRGTHWHAHSVVANFKRRKLGAKVKICITHEKFGPYPLLLTAPTIWRFRLHAQWILRYTDWIWLLMIVPYPNSPGHNRDIGPCSRQIGNYAIVYSPSELFLHIHAHVYAYP